jgi:hypothetical protein
MGRRGPLQREAFDASVEVAPQPAPHVSTGEARARTGYGARMRTREAV